MSGKGKTKGKWIVEQAVGMVTVQADCNLNEARARLRERAQSMDRTVEEIAAAVVERRIRVAPQ